MKKIIVFIFMIVVFKSCVIDSVQRFCVVKNTSKRTISVYFSNEKNLDSNVLAEQLRDSSFAIKKYSSGDLMENRYTFIDSNKIQNKVYVFFLDQDSINKYFQLPLTNNLIKKALLKSKEIDMLYFKSLDTLYYIE